MQQTDRQTGRQKQCLLPPALRSSITSCAARWPPQYAPAPWPWLLTLKSVWESHVTWGTPVQSFVFLGLLVFELEPMYATSERRTDGQTDTDHRLMPPRRGHNNEYHTQSIYVLHKQIRYTQYNRQDNAKTKDSFTPRGSLLHFDTQSCKVGFFLKHRCNWRFT